VASYGLPRNLKLSVHSGSDKFSIYPAIYASMMEFSTGVHLKTAGTNWLEELIGLAEAGATVLPGQEIYAEAFAHSASYARLMQRSSTSTRPNFPRREVNQWTSAQFTSALRHDPRSPAYNSSLRQLLHVGFKVAAKMGPRYLGCSRPMRL